MPALPSDAADTVSVLILTPTIASLLFTLSPRLLHVCAATANSTSALHSHPTQDCRELCTSRQLHTHTHAKRASSQPHSGRMLPSCFDLALSLSDKASCTDTHTELVWSSAVGYQSKPLTHLLISYVCLCRVQTLSTVICASKRLSEPLYLFSNASSHCFSAV